MIRINQLQLDIHHSDEELEAKICRILGIRHKDLKVYHIIRKSIDARKKNDIKYTYSISCEVYDEVNVLKRCKNRNVSKDIPIVYSRPESGNEKLKSRPVIVGFGPAGMFAGLSLARAGYNPLIIERGVSAIERKDIVEKFWSEGKLDPRSNVSFGEGGAGTFSDGKLNTLVRDESGRNTEVLRTFVEFGAPEDILYLSHPHIGTDKLIDVVTNIRKEIISLGGEVRFSTTFKNIISEKNKLSSVVIECNGKEETIDTEVLILAIGHSSRDTFEILKNKIIMQPKAFAVGFRIQHPQSMIDESQYGNEAEFLSPAIYKLAETSKTGRGVYSFCMCPGGYVVNASSEQGYLCVNGMSYHARSSGTANSAIIVTVTPEDFKSNDVLAGVEFQRNLEKTAFEIGEGSIPVQLLDDYINHNKSSLFGNVDPRFKGTTSFARLDKSFPDFIYESITDVMPAFGMRIKGFDRKDAILAGIESRTSSPVRIVRDENLVSSIDGIYPCGEGSGYAGGITSAAMDGLKIAERIIEKYQCRK